MDFTALRTQVIALLEREQRLSYRALKRQFALDDEDLEALKDELIYAKRLAIDEDGRVLVWTGETGTAAPATAQAETRTQAGIVNLTKKSDETVKIVDTISDQLTKASGGSCVSDDP